MEACRALGESTIPAVMSDASREEQLLMSLVENIARRPPSNGDLLREVKNLRERNYKGDEIARKLGRDRGYIHGIIHLVENSEAALVKAVEAGRLPISVAVKIATGNDREVQQAMSEAYENGDLRGAKLRNARGFITKRIARLRKAGKLAQTRRKLTGESLVREYKDRMREQRNLLKKANLTKERLLLLTTALRRLLADEHFVTLLRAESLFDMPEQLGTRIK
jgi:ParB family chromosome partitioning protein